MLAPVAPFLREDGGALDLVDTSAPVRLARDGGISATLFVEECADMPRKMGTRTVTVKRKPKVDRLSTSNPAETQHSITGCAVLPRTSHEEERGWVVVDGRMIVAPHGADVLADDKVVVDGATWDVDGAPGNYENRRGVGKATIFYLKRLGT